MQALIVGGGLIGLTTAHYLAERGARVTLVDAGPRPASGASHANGGLITPSMAEPWNAPGVMWQLMRWIGRPDAPLLLKPRGVCTSVGWMYRFMRASTPQSYRESTVKNIRLAVYSVSTLQALRRDTGLEYGAGVRGTMKVFRDQQSFDLAQTSMSIALDEGLKVQPLGRDETIALEPALAPIESRIVGSQYYPGDEIGDARRYCEALAAKLTARGCDIRYNVAVDGFVTRGPAIGSARTSSGTITADAYVLAAGAHSARLARPLGLAIPVQPVKGYSISVPMQTWSPRPALGLVDDTLHAGATPIGDRLRVAGTAEFTGFDTTVTPARIANLQRLVDALYPQASAAARGNDIEAWAGLRPMSPDGVPIIGRTPIGNLYVNTGHGTLGWTMAAGSGRLLAELITTGDTEIDLTGYAYARFT